MKIKYLLLSLVIITFTACIDEDLEAPGGAEAVEITSGDADFSRVVAMGAAIQAGVLQGDVKDVLLLDVTPLAKELNMFELLQPIDSVLINGNQSMIWLDSYSKGESIQALLQKGIGEMNQEETNFIPMKSIY